MQDIPIPCADCSCRKPAHIFPSRPSPEVNQHLFGLPRQRHARATADLIPWLRSRRTIARIIIAFAAFVSQMTSLTVFETAARAQRATRAESIDRFAKFIEEASGRFAVPARWIRAVMQVESSGDEHAISSRGAMGLMQIMPGTWVELSVRYGLGVDPFDARDNIFAGSAYLKEMHDRFGSAGFLAAYHAGPARYEQHLATGRPLPQETTAYVAAARPLLVDRQGERAAIRIRRVAPWQEAPLFVERVGAP